MDPEDKRELRTTDTLVWRQIRQAGATGLGLRQIVAEASVSLDVALVLVLQL
jgi:hypothetical protein